MSGLKRIEIKVTGLVQGVFFRQKLKAEAKRLGLTGWVRNEDDGSVKIVAEGREDDLQKLIEHAKLGTEFSRVDMVEVEWKEMKGEFDDFKIA